MFPILRKPSEKNSKLLIVPSWRFSLAASWQAGFIHLTALLGDVTGRGFVGGRQEAACGTGL